MKQSTKYVALDVHQAITVASVREASGRVLARVTLARKIAAITLRLWKRGERYDPTKLSMQG